MIGNSTSWLASVCCLPPPSSPFFHSGCAQQQRRLKLELGLPDPRQPVQCSPLLSGEVGVRWPGSMDTPPVCRVRATFSTPFIIPMCPTSSSYSTGCSSPIFNSTISNPHLMGSCVHNNRTANKFSWLKADSLTGWRAGKNG